ncbi:4Fe-4S single cluster domain-containing protein [Agromyces sp. NPDC056523]|uniref:4Fe-4S single cluster domain-containing protein n=1 Tax=Agromyces sp. NPDC056523 TaxID=3345850 RepID=UPI00366FB9C4
MSPDTIRIARFAAPVTVLGPGVRVAVWVQGCTIGCHGCASVDTWSSDAGTSADIEVLAADLARTAAEVGATGLTVTGGEPFQQPDEVTRLIDATRRRWDRGAEMDALVFTGYAAAAARRRAPRLWAVADAVIAGPYRRDRPSPHPVLGSANQTIETNTALGATRMARVAPARPAIQVAVDDGAVSLIGLPDPGDLDRLRAKLAARGIRLPEVSWDAESPDGGRARP